MLVNFKHTIETAEAPELLISVDDTSPPDGELPFALTMRLGIYQRAGDGER